MSRPVLLTLLLCPLLAVGQEDHTAADLAVQARAILEKHCIDCHGPKPSRSTLKILDHTSLTAVDRPVRLFSGNPKDVSLALDLITEGSMPPGSLAKVPEADIAVLQKWAAAGATKYPAQFDDEFAHQTILDDVNSLIKDREREAVTNARYLSLHHIAAKSPGTIDVARKEFYAALKNLIRPGAPISWVDATATICRIDVMKSGWGSKPFVLLDANGKVMKGDPVTATIYDLALLEYPHAVIPDSKVFTELAKLYLAPADQVRPIAFLRGDWFVATAMKSGLTRDLRILIKRAWSNLPPGLDPQRAGNPPAVRPPAATAKGVLLPAHDSWYGTDDPPAPDGAKGLTVDTVDPTDKKKDTFKAGDTFKAWVAVDPPAHVQYVYWSVSKVEYRSPFHAVLQAGKVESPVLPSTGFVPVDETETEYVRAFAAPHQFADGVNWGIVDVPVERFVHPFFKVHPTTGAVDLTAAKVTRKTTTIRIVPGK